jgi:hypothetical protein
MFHKRVYANDRLWLEGSFGTRSCCLAVIRVYDACYVYGNTGYCHHAESICKVRIGLWLLRISTHPSPVTAAVADYASYIELPRPGHISAVVYASAHLVSIRHLQPRIRISS